MLQAKPKKCDGCETIQPIWKKSGSKRYCKQCWNSQEFKGNSSTKKPTARKPLAARSSKIVKLNAAYMILRDQYMKHHPNCEAHLPGCTITASDIHHTHGRVGELYLDDTKFKAVCRNCHTVIHENPKLAKDLGLYH